MAVPTAAVICHWPYSSLTCIADGWLLQGGMEERKKSLRLAAIITGASGHNQKQPDAMQTPELSEGSMAQQRSEPSLKGGNS